MLFPILRRLYGLNDGTLLCDAQEVCVDQRLRPTATLGWALQLMRSRVFLAANLIILLALMVGIGLTVAQSLHWSFAPTARSAVSVTGPDTGAPANITACILGAVARPGVYTLANGARVDALVTAAGGALPVADLARVDMAARVNDGQEIYVPRVGEKVPVTIGGKVNINVASADDLHNALGISRTIAQRIVTYRVAHGPFTAVSQLLLVPVSQAAYDKIKGLVMV